MASTHDLLAAFGEVEDDNKYTRLIDNFTEDAVYYDPFYGPQVGKDAIYQFMSHMEKAVPAAGVRFENWTVTAGQDCGFAEWAMVAPNAEGRDVYVLGESLYRLKDGLVCGVIDYVDPIGYRHLTGDKGRIPDFAGAGGSLTDNGEPVGPAAATLQMHVSTMTHAGRWPGNAELIDCAGEDSVGWAQWTFRGPHGEFTGWSLHRPTGVIRDLFDTAAAARLSQT